jgi:uncharacterized protein involved in copper resistance
VPRLFRTAVWIGLPAALVVLGPAGSPTWADPPAAGWAASVTVNAPGAPESNTASSAVGTGHGSMPGMDDGSMPGMDHGSMPGMADGSSPRPGEESVPGMVHAHDSAAPVPRPRGRVIGGFVLVNGTVVVAAAIARRRTAGQRRRGRGRIRPAHA